MDAWPLVNAIRCTPSYLGEAELLHLLKTELSTINVATLKEIARVLGVSATTRKPELIVDIRTKVSELRVAPLTYEALREEAVKRDVFLSGLTYRDLRVVLGYEQIRSAGIMYFSRYERGTLAQILKVTDPGSGVRLTRLKQAYYEIISQHDLPSTSDLPQYRMLFSTAIFVNDDIQDLPLVYVDRSDDIGQVLLATLPGSIERKQLLQSYDQALLHTFRHRHKLHPGLDLMVLVTLNAPNPNHDTTYEYTHDRNPFLRILSTTKQDTLARYVGIAGLGMNPHLEELCHTPQLEDNRPHCIRDHSPDELEDLSLAMLQSLAIREGLYDYGKTPSTSRDILTDALTIAYVSPAFMRTDIVENTDQTQTCLLTELEDVSQGHLYAYGIRDGTGSYIYYEREELRMKFLTGRAFIDPRTNKMFDVNAIRRLYVLSLADGTAGADLFHTCIKDLLATTAIVTADERLLVQEFTDRPEIHQALELLLESGFYMRRWDGDVTKYPLLASETEPNPAVESDLEEEILFGRVNQSLERLRVAVDALPESQRERFWNLKLKNYIRSGYYSPDPDSDDGYTLRDRFQIVCQGNIPEAPINSCIRLTSGWFIFTALYYTNLIWRTNLRGIRAHELEFVS
jgi:hypothetical protein